MDSRDRVKEGGVLLERDRELELLDGLVQDALGGEAVLRCSRAGRARARVALRRGAPAVPVAPVGLRKPRAFAEGLGGRGGSGVRAARAGRRRDPWLIR